MSWLCPMWKSKNTADFYLFDRIVHKGLCHLQLCTTTTKHIKYQGIQRSIFILPFSILFPFHLSLSTLNRSHSFCSICCFCPGACHPLNIATYIFNAACMISSSWFLADIHSVLDLVIRLSRWMGVCVCVSVDLFASHREKRWKQNKINCFRRWWHFFCRGSNESHSHEKENVGKTHRDDMIFPFFNSEMAAWE